MADERLARTRLILPADQRELVRLDLSPETGPDRRIRVFVYRGSVPADPAAESAYRHVDLWLGDGGEQATATTTAGTTENATAAD